MADLDTGQTDAPTEGDSLPDSPSEPVQGDAAPEAAPDDLESLLSIFDNAVGNRGNGSQELIAEPEGEQPTDGAAGQDHISDSVLDDFVHSVAVLKDWAIGRDERDKAERDQRDAEALFAEGDETVSEFPLPEASAQNWLISKYMTDANFADAFEGRYDSDEAAKHYQRAATKALQGLREWAASAPDPELTANVAAVTLAVRGASKGSEPEGDYSWVDDDAVAKMSEQELSQWKKMAAKKMGY